MSLTLLAKCPSCKKTVRMPEEWASRTVRCKHCGMICQAKPNVEAISRKRVAAAPATTVTTSPSTPTVRPQTNLNGTEYSAPTEPVIAATIAVASATAANPNNFSPNVLIPPNPFDNWDVEMDQPVIEPNAGGRKGNYRHRKRSWVTMLVGLAMLAAFAGALGTAGYYLYPKFKGKLQEVRNTDDGSSKSGAGFASINDPNKSTPIAPGQQQFPRRILGICVNNYLFANPISYGYDPRSTSKTDKRSFNALLTRLGDKLKIPRGQIYELSDGAIGRSDYDSSAVGNQHRLAKMLSDWRSVVEMADKSAAESPPVPVKPIIEQTIAKFIETSRSQDRIILIFVGHAVEVEGKTYLAPMEGDLDEVKTLIPLEWVYQQLEKCPAQQKVLVVDVGRFDKARGLERSNGGKMSAKTEKALKNPPAGVQVWSACSADQYSHEFDDYASFQGFDVKGGAFLSLIFKALSAGTGIPRPEDPLPVDALAAKVNDDVKKMFEATVDDEKMGKVTKAEQVPFLAGKSNDEQVAYNADEPPAAGFSIPTPAQVFTKGPASRREIASLIGEIQLPPTKAERATDSDVSFGGVVPFSAEVMDKYKSDGKTVAEVMKEPERYALRVAAIKAIDKLREIGKTGRVDLPEEVYKPATDAEKANFRNLQKGPARIMNDLREVLEDLEKAGEERKDEKSKRWQIHYDFVLAMVKAKYAYMHEYSLMTGQVRRDAMPELPSGTGWGWRLAASEKMQSNNDVKEMVKDARKLLQKIAKDYPGTPWEVMAKRERMTAMGLEWQITNFGAPTMSKDK